jgi:hypothetical protein
MKVMKGWAATLGLCLAALIPCGGAVAAYVNAVEKARKAYPASLSRHTGDHASALKIIDPYMLTETDP